MKLAAAEGLQEGGTQAPFSIVPGIEVPGVLSLLATHDVNGYVPGINNLLQGYTTPDGTSYLSAQEKMQRGKQARAAFADFRKNYRNNPEAAAEARTRLQEDVQFFGYGFIEKAEDLVPPVWLVYWSFRIMVGLGSFLMLFLIVVWWMQRKGKLEHAPLLQWVGIAAVPMVYLAGQAGWVVAEVGRQPWAIQDLLPLGAAVSQISPSGVITTFFLFLLVFTVLLVAEVKIMCKAISQHKA